MSINIIEAIEKASQYTKTVIVNTKRIFKTKSSVRRKVIWQHNKPFVRINREYYELTSFRNITEELGFYGKHPIYVFQIGEI